MNVSAIIVTRGDQDLIDILKSLDEVPVISETIVWDNGAGTVTIRQRNLTADHFQVGLGDLAVYGRYEAIGWASNEVVFVQDDDCIVDAAAAIAAYEPGILAANMPQEFRPFYPDSCLVGFGAVFDDDLPDLAFGGKWSDPDILSAADFAGAPPDFFNRTCDVVFTTLTPRKLVDVPCRNLPWATGRDRMYRQPEHVGERNRMLRLARRVRDA